MQLCRFGEGRYGVVEGDVVRDVTQIVDDIAPLSRVPFKGDPVIARLDEIRHAIVAAGPRLPTLALKEVALLCPVAAPSKVAAAPRNYRAHMEEMEADHQRPRREGLALDIEDAGLFLKANSALVGASEGVTLRFPERRNDHEIELVAVIGRAASHVPVSEALGYVAGYAIGLDMTVRGKEDRSFRKSVDSYAVVGPWLVTADAIPDPADLELTLTLNGVLRQQTSTRQMILNVAELIAFGSRFYTLFPGDLLFTGTCQGVGPVQPGDVMEARCSRIGAMTVPVHGYAR
jgi:2,4-didehydro-3-deoxy-L-rhamnonate hydrolase